MCRNRPKLQFRFLLVHSSFTCILYFFHLSLKFFIPCKRKAGILKKTYFFDSLTLLNTIYINTMHKYIQTYFWEHCSCTSCLVQCIGFSRNISHIEKKNWKNQTSSFYFKKLNKVPHGTAYMWRQFFKNWDSLDGKAELPLQSIRLKHSGNLFRKKLQLIGVCWF